MADSKPDFTPDYSRYPWKHVNSLAQIYKDSPALIALEFVSLAIYLALALHAVQRRKLRVLISATVAGAANELIFINISLVNNFWHAQSWIMLTPRLPAWQPALYGFFLYVASQSAARLRFAGWGTVSRAAAAGILGFLLLFPIDAVCVKFVAYTWHDSDALLADRLMGVAIGNGMFAAAFSACFLALIHLTGPIGASLLSTPIMVLVTQLICQYVGGGVPTRGGFVVLLVALTTIVAMAALFARRTIRLDEIERKQDWQLTTAALIFFSVLLAVSIFTDPTQQKSIGFHQPISLPGDGPCRVDTELSASGRDRMIFLCPGTLGLSSSTWGDFDPLCDPGARIDEHWYALCGRPFGLGGGGWGRRQFVASLSALAAMGLAGLAACQTV